MWDNFLVTRAKYFIYICKDKDVIPLIDHFLRYLNLVVKVQDYILRKKQALGKFHGKKYIPASPYKLKNKWDCEAKLSQLFCTLYGRAGKLLNNAQA